MEERLASNQTFLASEYCERRVATMLSKPSSATTLQCLKVFAFQAIEPCSSYSTN